MIKNTQHNTIVFHFAAHARAHTSLHNLHHHRRYYTRSGAVPPPSSAEYMAIDEGHALPSALSTPTPYSLPSLSTPIPCSSPLSSEPNSLPSSLSLTQRIPGCRQPVPNSGPNTCRAQTATTKQNTHHRAIQTSNPNHKEPTNKTKTKKNPTLRQLQPALRAHDHLPAGPRGRAPRVH